MGNGVWSVCLRFFEILIVDSLVAKEEEEKNSREKAERHGPNEAKV